MDRARVEEAVTASLPKGVHARYTWQDEDREVRLEVTMPRGAIVVLNPAGLPDRWGRKVEAGPAISVVSVPEVTIRRFTYDPATDEAHPFSWHQVPGVFAEGVTHPDGSDRMLLMAQGLSNQGPTYRAYLLGDGVPGDPTLRPVGDQVHSLYPRFYGWLPDGGMVLAGDNKAKAYAPDRTPLREFPLPEAGYLHGGAVNPANGRVALFVSDKFTAGTPGEMRLVIWDPATGEVKEHGVMEPRRGTPGGDAFAWQWVEAAWAPDGKSLYFATFWPWKYEESALYRLDLANGGAPQRMATGYRRPIPSPVGNGLVLVDRTDRSGSVILGPDGQVAHTLPAHTWHWHLSGEALDGGAPGVVPDLPYTQTVLYYRLADKRLIQRGIGLVLGHGPGPGNSSLMLLVLTQR